jgi:hypothetical protein
MSSRVTVVDHGSDRVYGYRKVLGPISWPNTFHPRGGSNSSDETTRCCGQSEKLITVCSKGLRHLRTWSSGHGRLWGGVSAVQGALASLEGCCRVRCGAEVSRYQHSTNACRTVLACASTELMPVMKGSSSTAKAEGG